MKRDKINIRLKPGLLADIRKRAAEQNISVSRYIEKVLEGYKLIKLSTYYGPEFHKPSLKEEQQKECQDCAEFGNSGGPCGFCIEKNYWRKNDEVTDMPLEMRYIGFSSHGCESWYKCPVCGKSHSSWGFFNKNLKASDVMICECGAKLKIPR